MSAKNSFAEKVIEPKYEILEGPGNEWHIDMRGLPPFVGWDYRPLRRIRALRDFGDVRKGDLGGFVQAPNLLSHEGNCWVYDEATVFSGEKSYDTVLSSIRDNAQVRGTTRIDGGIVEGDSIIRGDSYCIGVHLSGNTVVNGPDGLSLSGRIHDNVPDATAALAIAGFIFRDRSNRLELRDQADELSDRAMMQKRRQQPDLPTTAMDKKILSKVIGTPMWRWCLGLR